MSNVHRRDSAMGCLEREATIYLPKGLPNPLFTSFVALSRPKVFICIHQRNHVYEKVCNECYHHNHHIIQSTEGWNWEKDIIHKSASAQKIRIPS